MTRPIHVLALDGGLAHLGWTRAVVYPDSVVKVSAMGLIATKKARAAGDVVRVSADNVRRAREVANALAEPLGLSRGSGGGIEGLEDCELRAIVMEAMSHAPSASAVGQLSMSLGVVATWAELLNLQVVEVTPQEVKRAMGVEVQKGAGRLGNDAAKALAKRQVQEAVGNRLFAEQRALLDGFLSDIPQGQREHPCDALAALYTAVDRGRLRGAP